MTDKNAVKRVECNTCATLTRFAPDCLEPGRTTPIRKQVWEPATKDDGCGEMHECGYAVCEDCDEDTCECDGSVCESCMAHLCNDCRIYTEDGHFCSRCCSSGYSYHAVEALAEKNHLLRTALKTIAETYLTESERNKFEQRYYPRAMTCTTDHG